MAYQPKMTLRTKQLAGYESLLRWRSPGGEPLSPELVIRAAEMAGEEVADGLLRLIVRSVLRDIKTIPEHMRVPVAINLSPRQVSKETGLMILNEICAAKVGGGLLDIEVTEHVPVGDIADFSARLHDIRPYVGKVFIDDFGVGYSNLSSLHSLKVDGVKLDRVFMANASTDIGLSFVCSVVDMCHIVGVSVVIEGVENDRDHSFAVCCGADFGQGYAYGRPVIGRFESITLPKGCGRECGGRYVPGKCDRATVGEQNSPALVEFYTPK